MPKYMIHTTPKRMWYVKEFLLPSMLEQGISDTDVTIYTDTENKGNLESCMASFKSCITDGGTWHLQDDVVICSDFAKRTALMDKGIVCTFCTSYDRRREHCIGKVPVEDMWYSFPCIRLPNKIATECADWYYTYMQRNPVYRHLVKQRKHDDEIFRMFMESHYKGTEVDIINAVPNFIDHVDWLIGGSTVNAHRNEPARASYFNEPELVEELKLRLEHTVER